MKNLLKPFNLIIIAWLFFGYLKGSYGADNSNVSINTSRGNTDNYDEIKTSEGVSCRQAMGSNLTAEIGVGQAEAEEVFNEIENNNKSSGGIAAFGRITYAIGAPKRIDCSQIYELELIKLREELRQLQEN